MSQEPHASAKRVFWIVDNGSSHRGQKAADRLTAAFLNTVMLHTPVHASWLNQVEIYFSAVQRRALSPNDFTDLTEVRDRLRAFEGRYPKTAVRARWMLAGDRDGEGEVARVAPGGVPGAPDVLEKAELVLSRPDDAIGSRQGCAEVPVGVTDPLGSVLTHVRDARSTLRITSVWMLHPRVGQCCFCSAEREGRGTDRPRRL
ncbi:transposase [Streptomyces sp. NPDC050636]|uniref:transposase n=1 Tax=Streptomyces sp. NPDC050636 TaxID=3154510 RepID=UPI0034144368